MTIEERLTLARAGYTAAQIDAFETAAADPQPAPAPAPADPAPAPAPSAAPAADPAPAQAGNPTPAADLDSIMAAIDQKFAEMSQALRTPAAPSINTIKPLGIEDVIRNFFKED